MAAPASPRLPRDLLARPAEEGVRRIALAELSRAETARAALVEGEDPEALHDFRVAIRRLRSHLRAFRDEIGGLAGKRLRKKLSVMADATNPGRDAEVSLVWLERLGGRWARAETRGVEFLRQRLTERRDAAYRAVAAEVVPPFGALAPRLREKLARYRIEVRLDGDAPRPLAFGAALALELDRHHGELAAALAAVAAVTDEAAAHRARIEGKRLRYLLEPVTPRLRAARPLVERLKGLQDALGDLNDLHVLAATVAEAAADAEAERARRATGAVLAGDPDGRRQRAELRQSERAGLLALARRIAERRDALFAEFAKAWLGAAAPAAMALHAELQRLLRRLRPPAAAR